MAARAQPRIAQEMPVAAPDNMARRELYFFNLYRAFEATVLAGLCFSPFAEKVITLVSPLTAKAVALAYLFGAVSLFAYGRFVGPDSRAHIVLGLSLDVLAALTAMTAINGFESGIATLLLVNISCGALMLPARPAILFAALASVAVVGAFGITGTGIGEPELWSEGALFAVGYIAATLLCQVLRRQMVDTYSLAQRREIDLANLTQLNDLIIRRMRTGVIVVDSENRIHRINEAAWQLLGNPSPTRKELGDVAAELSRRLYHWRTHHKVESVPVALAEGVPEVIPRFVRLATGDEASVIIFLDDISLLSRQAEQLTLSSLGRLSASIAHEVRNPLTAISYSAQLLSESRDLPEPDQRLVDIIRTQCVRMNAIVENILQLSRRERSRPDRVELASWVVAFVEECRGLQPLGQDELRAVPAPSRDLWTLVDPGQLHQIVWNLVQNALRYGRLPQEPARVSIAARRLNDNGPPVIEVIDRGPGIPKRVAEQIFDPFFTTHEHGTGLGLYIARQITEANQATLDYVPVAGGGSCFRITLSPAAVAPESGTSKPFAPAVAAR